MKKLFAIFCIFCMTGVAFAERYPSLFPKSTNMEIKGTFDEMPYQVNATTLALTGAVTYYGFATDISIKVKGVTTEGSQSSVTYWTSFQKSTATLYQGDILDLEFAVPVDSPTIVGLTLTGGASVQVMIGGLKKDSGN